MDLEEPMEKIIRKGETRNSHRDSLPPLATDEAIVFLSESKVREAIRDEISTLLEQAPAETQPLTVSRSGLAKLLGFSTSTVDAMRKQGMPETRMVDSPRWIVADVLQWLRKRARGGSE